MSFDQKAATWDDDPMKQDRAKAVATSILSALPRLDVIHALEFGCGTGLLSFALREHLSHITLADNSDGMLNVLRQKIAAQRIENMSVAKLDVIADPLPERRFQLIYSLMTIHHIQDTATMLARLFALLDNHGQLCLADLDREDGSFHGTDFVGHHGFDRTQLEKTARTVGFDKISFDHVFTIDKPRSAGQTQFPVFLMIAHKA